MKSLLDGISSADLCYEPFPHLIIRNPYETEFCKRLLEEFPSISAIVKEHVNTSNKRFSYSAVESLNNPEVSDAWKSLVRAHTSQKFLNQLLSIFGEQILKIYPDFEARFGKLNELKSGLRKVDTHENADVLMDAQICINTPVLKRPNSVRGPHVDLPNKLFVGLFYLRAPEDDSKGGDLELYKIKKVPFKFRKTFIDNKYVEAVKILPYDQNVAVFFINSPEALHGVTIRRKTKWTRYFFNLVSEVNGDLFDLTPFQRENAFIERLFEIPRWLKNKYRGTSQDFY